MGWEGGEGRDGWVGVCGVCGQGLGNVGSVGRAPVIAPLYVWAMGVESLLRGRRGVGGGVGRWGQCFSGLVAVSEGGAAWFGPSQIEDLIGLGGSAYVAGYRTVCSARHGARLAGSMG